MKILHFTVDDIAKTPFPLDDEVHIWNLSLGALERVQELSKNLTEEECGRARRLHLARVREQFVLSRGYLRAVLGGYLGLPGREAPIAYEPGGKPFLAASGNRLQFNLSHSGEKALIAATFASRVGVDVEQRREKHEVAPIVERYFSPRDRQAFLALPMHERSGAFYRAWTRKEAVLKAIGSGVQSIEECDVTFGPGEAPALLRLQQDIDAGAHWFLHGWDLGEGYEAAVAVEQHRL